MRHTFKISFVLALGLALASTACGKKKVALQDEEANLVRTSYEVQCGPAVYPGMYSTEEPPKLPDTLPMVSVPLRVNTCAGLGADPQFLGGEMPGLVAIVDCNAKLVRFRTRNWEVNEAAAIGANGKLDLRIMHIVRLMNDVAGNQNCWTRLLGRISGKATCPGNPADARLEFKVDWTVDETPSDAMEVASPGLADLRNGKQCRMRPGNCSFSNAADVGCGG